VYQPESTPSTWSWNQATAPVPQFQAEREGCEHQKKKWKKLNEEEVIMC